MVEITHALAGAGPTGTGSETDPAHPVQETARDITF